MEDNFFWWVVISNEFICIFELLNQKTMKNKMNEQVKFARWVLIHTDEAKHTAGVCRFYKNKLYTIDEIFDVYTNIQSKSENAELTPHIEYYDNGNVLVKGQKNSKGEREGLWEIFYEDGNISLRTPYKEGKRDGIQEDFDGQGNITETCLWKDGKLIETTEH